MLEDSPEVAIAKAMGAYDNLGRHLLMSHREELTKSQADVLLGLFVFGSMNMSQISEHLAVSKEQATRAVAPLVERGYVARERNPEHRRSVVISLTEQGRQDVLRRNDAAVGEIRSCISCLSEEDRQALIEASRTAERVIRKLWFLRG